MKALLVLCESAADCIRGGLFDPEIESVVPVESLLALLGEALPLLGGDQRIASPQQVFALLRIVEDFSTCPRQIQEHAAELVQASLQAFRENSTKQQHSAGQPTAQYLWEASWDVLAKSTVIAPSDDGNGRSWDWRHGLDAVTGADASGADVVAMLRTALAEETGRLWMI